MIYRLWAAAVAVALCSCVYDDADYCPDLYEEGVETAVALNVSLPRMRVATRADMESGTDSEVNTLWIGIFSAKTGLCTYAGYHNNAELFTEHGDFTTLPAIKTLSGLSYIVAVGNPKDNYGFDRSKGSPVPREELSTILPVSADAAQADGFTWNRYCNLAIRQLPPNDISTPINNLVMSGVYYDHADADNNNDPKNAADWETLNYKPVRIGKPAAGETTIVLDGAIHLRRLISKVEFNISPAPSASKGGINVVSVTPVSYRVVNVPYVSWLHERAVSTDVGNTTNAGDVMRLSVTSLTYDDTAALPMRANYLTSSLFSGQDIEGNSDGSYSFDFWMLENKRRALTDNIPYEMREKEQKTAGELPSSEINTGIYTALCGNGAETMNNAATFVEIHCTLEYTDEGLEEANRNGDGDLVHRHANVVYTVHLGGVGNDWSDFIHRRNHKYTYKIQVVDLEKIIVEADDKEEQSPGTEGVVTDVRESIYELDAHYGVLNVSLSNRERTNGSGAGAYEKFPFRLEVYYNDRQIILDQDNLGSNPLLWQWVEFRATSGENVIADYKPYIDPSSPEFAFSAETYKTFRLTDLADIERFPAYGDGTADPNDDTQRWYTVFINEYVYENSSDESVSSNWTAYVNQQPRSCWLMTNGGSSYDGESVHLHSKFMITQRSIQSFYDIPDNMSVRDINALGLEHTNETYGFNLRWYENEMWFPMSNINGRLNQIQYARNNPYGDGLNWTTYYNPSALQVINDINTSNVQYGKVDGTPAPGPYYVPAINTRGRTLDESGTGNMNGNVWRYNINNSQYLAIMSACMNRNRDNNGDGRLDRNEIRWYLPTSSELVDLVLGRNSLETPLMNFNKNTRLDSPQGGHTDKPHHGNTRFHYATSNKRVLWAEEGSTINAESDIFRTVGYDGSPWNLPPQQIRCVRALSTNLESDAEEAISPAYTVDDESAPTKIYPTFYDNKNMRPYTATPLPPHQESSTMNRLCYDGFEFKKEIIKVQRYFEVRDDWNTAGGLPGFFWYHRESVLQNLSTHDADLNEANRLCQSSYGSEWRLPTMKEAALIKMAISGAGIYPPSNTWPSTVNGYDFDNFLTCTYREYGIPDSSVADPEVRARKTGYYTGVLYWYPQTNDEIDRDDNGNIIGRISCITNTMFPFNIRCVRDLQGGN